MTATQTLNVALGARSYPIHIGAGILREAGRFLAPTLSVPRAVIVSNPTVAKAWLAPLRESLASAGIASETLLIPDGEMHKSWATLHDVLTRLLEQKAERSTTIVALGGGVVGDVAGFAAAIYQRGMPFVQIPTTLLAQVDSSVGGKTGVNHLLGKNMIGAFYQPRAVLIDPECLRTLPERELASGLAEVVKYGAIRARGFFEWLEANDALAFGLDHTVGNLAIQRIPLHVKLGESRQRIGGNEERPMPAPSRTLAQRRRVGMEVEDRPVFPET